jgi:undecaprenyl-diphosphatase
MTSPTHHRPFEASSGEDVNASEAVYQEPGRTASDPYAANRRWPWDARRTITVSLLWVVGVVLLALVSFAARHAGPFPGDVGIEEAIQRIHQPLLVHFINFSSDANWPMPAGITAITVIVLLAIFRQIRAALTTAIASFGADYVNVTLNSQVHRPRPYGTHIHAVAHLGLYSYPSGHVTHVVAFYGFLLYLTVIADRARPRLRPLMLVVRVVAVYFIAFIGLSRLLEGAHWPSDVLASYLLGALMLVFGIVLFHLLGMLWARIRERRQIAAQ